MMFENPGVPGEGVAVEDVLPRGQEATAAARAAAQAG